MKNQNDIDAVKRAKNIAAIVYMLVLTVLVGGSYINQHYRVDDAMESQSNRQ